MVLPVLLVVRPRSVRWRAKRTIPSGTAVETWRVRTLRCGEAGWEWEGDFQTGDLVTEFPDEATAFEAGEAVWGRQPDERDFASESAYLAALYAWREEADAAEDARWPIHSRWFS